MLRFGYILVFVLFSFIGKSQLVPFKDSTSQLYGFQDATGKIVVTPTYTMAEKFSDGRAAVNKGAVIQFQNVNGGKWGFVDSVGKLVIPMDYDYVQPFKDGKARVVKEHKSMLIDKSGNYIDETKVYFIYPNNQPVNWGSKN